MFHERSDSVMSAMAPRQPGATFEETADYTADAPGFDRPQAKGSPQSPHRYVYGSGSRPLDGYTIKRAIGRGGFGEVYYAASDSGKEVALKLITRNVEVERRGVAQCMNLKCPNLLTIHDIRSNDAGENFVVMEYVAGPSLTTILAKNPNGLPEHEVRAWLKGLVEGVDYLHDHGIVHRDLKPANLFMEEGIVKIGDYGLSKIISPEQGSEHSESIGTCHYMAPEISNGKYGKPIDIYAIGVILYELLTGRVPFEGETVGEVLMKHLTARPDLSPLAEPWKSIIGKALAKVPADRQTRALDLLPPDVAPPARAVRFIGEGKVMPPTEAEGHAALKDLGGKVRAKHDDVLRITDEEPPFYIGPNTRPPVQPGPARRFRPVQAVVPPIRWLTGVVRSRPAQPMNPAPAARAARLVAWRRRETRVVQTPAPRPQPSPPTAQPLPSVRVRIAELTGSMIWATVATALLCLPIAVTGAIDLRTDPQNLAFLFAMTLAGSWGILTANKVIEGRKVEPMIKRFIYLFVGAGLGVLGTFLSSWLLPNLTPGRPTILVFNHEIGHYLDQLDVALLGKYMTYFALAYFVNGWWKVTERDRPAKLRIWPIMKAGVLGLCLTPLWPYQELWSVCIVTMTAVVLQLASPWSSQAAAYARHVRKQEAEGIRIVA
jgi:serine/threonine protein kinase